MHILLTFSCNVYEGIKNGHSNYSIIFSKGCQSTVLRYQYRWLKTGISKYYGILPYVMLHYLYSYTQ